MLGTKQSVKFTICVKKAMVRTDRKSVDLGSGPISVKVLSLTMQQFTQYGQSKKLDMRQSLLITTQKQFQQTSVFLTNYTLNH